MKYIDAEKLIAEIERLKGLYAVYQDEFKVDDDVVDLPVSPFFYEGKCRMCDEISSAITSLQQEQPEVDSSYLHRSKLLDIRSKLLDIKNKLKTLLNN